MLMPETPVYENYFFSFRKDDVGMTRQGLSVEPESVSKAVQEAAYGQFGRHILVSDAPHVLTPSGRANSVHSCRFSMSGTA